MRFQIGLVAVLASACTGSIDTGGDNPPPPPPVTDVQIVVQDAASPQANVRVLFQNADGSLIAEVATDTAGRAVSEMPNGGNLTVIRTFPMAVDPNLQRYPEIYSYVGIKAGDRLVLGNETDTLGSPGAINVKVPTGAQGTVTVLTSCGSGQGTAPNVAITTAGCPANLSFYITDANQDSLVAKAAYSSSVDISQGMLSQNLSTTLSAQNVLPGMSQVDAEVRIVDGTFALYSSTPKRIDAQNATINLPHVDGVDELVVATIRATDGTQLVADRRAYSPTPTIVDAGAGVIPYVTTPTYAPTGISWIEKGTGAADFVIATIDVTPGPQGGGTLAPYRRVIVAPHSGTSLPLPRLVGADSIFNPTAGDQLAGTHGIVRATGGYDAARAHVFSVTSVVQTAPMGGMVTVSYAGNNPPTL